MTTQLDLLGDAPPKAPRVDVDFYNRVAIKLRSLPAEWRWHTLRGAKTKGDDGVLVIGGVPGEIVNGRPNWKKPVVRGTACELLITTEQLVAERALYRAETGLCDDCSGNGEAFAGWSAEKGNRYSSCGTCKGTGKAAGS